VQQEAAPSCEIPISGAPACVIGSNPIIFGRSQILPSRPLFTVAYIIHIFTLKNDPTEKMTRNKYSDSCFGSTSPFSLTFCALTRVRTLSYAYRCASCRVLALCSVLGVGLPYRTV
jgi:hypothetical protein